MGFDIDLLGPLETNDSLAHYGVKGMRWGVRKSDDRKGQTLGNLEEYKAIEAPRLSNREKTHHRQVNEAKSLAKLKDPVPSDPIKGLTPEQKRMMYVAGGGLAAAAIIGGAFYLNGRSNSSMITLQERGIRNDSKLREQVEAYRKKTWDPSNPGASFENMVEFSKNRTWSGDPGYIQPSSWARPAFEIPAGTVFNRVSGANETVWNDFTYITHNAADTTRYLANFANGISADDRLRLVSSTSKGTVKVPDLHTTLETVREVLSSRSGAESSPKEAWEAYRAMSGGSWESDRARDFFDALRKKGYSAIVDEMDAGVIGDTPLVLFNPSLMGDKTNKLLDVPDFESAWQNVTELTNRK